MTSHNATTTTLHLPSRSTKPRPISHKNHQTTSISSLLFNDQLRLTTSLPSFNLSPPSSRQALFASAKLIPPWTATSDASDPLLRDEPTRVRLQRQRLRELHASSHVHTKFPGFKTSAAFFASLRTNLRLSIATPSHSPMSTPPSMRASATSLPPPSPIIDPAESTVEVPPVPDDPLAGVPELRSYRADSDEDNSAAIQLVADSVAQMRRAASNHLMLHPLLLAILVVVLAIFTRVSTLYDIEWTTIVLGWLVLCLTFFVGCRFATQAYVTAADSINWDWLGDADVLVTTFGDEIIGTVVIDWVSGESRQKRKKAWRGEVKAWTVRLKYRNKGVGTALLEDAAQEAHCKGAECLDFATDHANSLRPLPRIFNKPFDEQDIKSRSLLQSLFEGNSARAKRR